MPLLPKDTKTFTTELIGASSSTITNNTSTILSAHIVQSGTASNTKLNCGNNEIGKTYGRDMYFIYSNYVCNDILWISKTGQDSSFIVVNYLPYDISNPSSTMEFKTYQCIEKGVITECYEPLAVWHIYFISFIMIAIVAILIGWGLFKISK